MDTNFFKKLYADDIIYHYTKASTAIDYILYRNQLKFNEGRNSNDPIESSNTRRVTVYSLNNPLERSTVLESNKLNEYISNLEDKFCQICFCKNNKGSDFGSKCYHGSFKGHEELFGFTKLRMWDQYADKFTGVCIALSKEKILSLNKEILALIEDDVKYFSFGDLSLRKMGNIQGDYLANDGKYQKKIKEIVKQSFFYKHLDYAGENEYRIGVLYDEKYCCAEKLKDKYIFNKTIMLDISGCVEAIFVSSYANDKQKSALLEYANKLDISIVEMKWQHDSFVCRDYKKWIKLGERLKIEQVNKVD
ncbi:DUF2971 domain-containing protein [Labilibaculum euxinus]|uniref:DUF2971 domain-containing protein n=1 Tax=Labilibaculum euxinus TaxID=2686357 RepID=A0A7M4DB47_9BACT|nr:DUF2971 domain-containing protein [Labilibaculum euxinus]MUP39876.1 DUF2971 domain-containing protein [Labilibaculum euxinus]MVB09081.1 DUF2971 domain-containing protein [Labilibaculum euxinus]